MFQSMWLLSRLYQRTFDSPAPIQITNFALLDYRTTNLYEMLDKDRHTGQLLFELIVFWFNQSSLKPKDALFTIYNSDNNTFSI